MPSITIENIVYKTDEERDKYFRDLDNGGLLAQQCVQQGAIDAIRFLLSQPSAHIREVAEQMEQDLSFVGFKVAEECARRGLIVVQAAQHQPEPGKTDG